MKCGGTGPRPLILAMYFLTESMPIAEMILLNTGQLIIVPGPQSCTDSPGTCLNLETQRVRAMSEPLSMSTFLALAVCQEFWYVRYCSQPKPHTSTVRKPSESTGLFNIW
jgi:hypothetical protein